jgi:3'-phosphoadenosine 5'-phosphosulfate sulfotransferase (PAPS reductase)/FAD synthetase
MNNAELKKRQGWTLEQKIDHSIGVIEKFVERMGGIDKVYISFSGGRDSTVLLHIARRIYPNIKSMFINTTNEYPEIVKFIRSKIDSGEDIDVCRPERTVFEVWENVGFPLVSKNVSEMASIVKNKPNSKKAERIKNNPIRQHRIPNRWSFLPEMRFNCSSKCCDILKKEPAKKYEKSTGRHPIVGTMACESELRTATYISQGGCNILSGVRPISKPLSIWTQEDVLEYIRRYNIDISDIYNDGRSGSGCMSCGFGITMESCSRFKHIKNNYPRMYNKIMNLENGGVKFGDALNMTLCTVKKELLSWERQ